MDLFTNIYLRDSFLIYIVSFGIVDQTSLLLII